MMTNIIDHIKLPFRKEKELFSALYRIMGFYPHDIQLYKQALMHKSAGRRMQKGGRPVNNERLEFLGDAVLDAVVGDIVFRHFEGKREGFLTNTRSKLVARDTLGKLAKEMGITDLVKSAGHITTHNNYMGGNAFEALVGAIYLDRGYDACMQFMKNRILAQLINIDKVAYKEVNFKSKLLEWSQKNRVQIEFRELSETRDSKNSPMFKCQVFLEGLEGCVGEGYSKKESQQTSAKETLQRLRREPQFIDAVFAAKGDRTKMEEEPVENVPDTEDTHDFIITQSAPEPEKKAAAKRKKKASSQDAKSASQDAKSSSQDAKLFSQGAKSASQDAEPSHDSDEFSLDDIPPIAAKKTRKSAISERERIIAEAEAAAFGEM